MHLNLSADEVLTATRAVRKRLDLDRPVEREVIEECIEIGCQAPTGGNNQPYHWLVVTDPEVKATMDGLFADIERVDHVEDVVDPYTAPTPQISRDGTIAFAEIRFDVKASEVPKEVVDEILALGERAAGPGLQIEFGGPVVENAQFEPPGQSTTVALIAAMIILLIAFPQIALWLPSLTQ